MRVSLLAPGVVMSMGMPQRPQGRAAACSAIRQAAANRRRRLLTDQEGF
jgi:hypothetical protein